MPPHDPKKTPPQKGALIRFATHPAVWLMLIVTCLLGGLGYLVVGCGEWDPRRPFERNAPDVDRAIDLYDAGQFESAAEALETYLNTGPCSDGSIGLPPQVRQKHNGSFDLGLTLFHLAEKYGRRFGEEEAGDAGTDDPEETEKRSLEIDCAQIIVKAIASDPEVPVELRARAAYLSGNLEFLRKAYEDAVDAYDQALGLVPGIDEDADGDAIGRDAAWNRAIALRRLQEEEEQDADQEQEQEPDAGDEDADAGDDGDDDAGDGEDGSDGGDGQDDADAGGDDAGDPDGGDPDDAGDDGGDQGEGDQDGGQDAGEDDGGQGDQDDQNPDMGPMNEPPEGDPKSERAQMERLLDELEEAPTYQEEESKRRAAQGKQRRVMEDK
ncbi:MAG: hypothetical protein KC731_24685 [Myxococcales bacterium]|nr:hypothetical protein [Myxococcales bacterium]